MVELVDTVVSKATAVMHVGSSPTGTTFCLCDGIGRHGRLRICWEVIVPYGFESLRGY